METINVHVRRSKLRRFFETEMRKTNAKIKEKCLNDGYGEYIFIRFSPHMIDRLTDRHIDEHKTMELFNKVETRLPEIFDFLKMEDRPNRLEITDGNMWIGMTVDLIEDGKPYHGLCCRMIIENPKRLAGKMSAVVLKVDQ